MGQAGASAAACHTSTLCRDRQIVTATTAAIAVANSTTSLMV
jgi:hypothetical protein